MNRIASLAAAALAVAATFTFAGATLPPAHFSAAGGGFAAGGTPA